MAASALSESHSKRKTKLAALDASITRELADADSDEFDSLEAKADGQEGSQVIVVLTKSKHVSGQGRMVPRKGLEPSRP